MSNSLKTNSARLLLLISIIFSSPKIFIYNADILSYINIQFILIFALRISSPQTNFNHVWFLFLASLINDVLTGLTLGTSGLIFLTIHAVASFQASIKLRSIFLSEWFAFGVAMIFAYLILGIIDQIIGFDISYNKFLLNFLFTILAYPIFWYPITKLYA